LTKEVAQLKELDSANQNKIRDLQVIIEKLTAENSALID
jgi:hypothetical protein